MINIITLGFFLVFLVAYTAKYMGKSSLLRTDQQWLYLAPTSYGSLQPDTKNSANHHWLCGVKAYLNEEMNNFRPVSEMEGIAGGKKVKLAKVVDEERDFIKGSIQFVTSEFSCTRDKLLRSSSGSCRRDWGSSPACQTRGVHSLCSPDHRGQGSWEGLEEHNWEEQWVLF